MEENSETATGLNYLLVHSFESGLQEADEEKMRQKSIFWKKSSLKHSPVHKVKFLQGTSVDYILMERRF